MKFGKTIKIFLIEGNASSLMTCELSNWTGKAYKVPRLELNKLMERPDVAQAGIYLLFGRKENNKDLAYIGEAENIILRLNQQIKEKDFWNEVILFISKDQNLNKAHIKYLESRLYEISKKNDRYELVNGNTPTKSNISESDIAEMEEFISNIKILTNTLGHKIFEEKVNKSNDIIDESKYLYIKSNRGSDAIGELTNEGFLVFKDSHAAGKVVASYPEISNKLRNELIEKKILKSKDEYYLFTEDYLFSSPSTAAMIVMGRSANGLIEWKNKNGIKLKEL